MSLSANLSKKSMEIDPGEEDEDPVPRSHPISHAHKPSPHPHRNPLKPVEVVWIVYSHNDPAPRIKVVHGLNYGSLCGERQPRSLFQSYLYSESLSLNSVVQSLHTITSGRRLPRAWVRDQRHPIVIEGRKWSAARAKEQNTLRRGQRGKVIVRITHALNENRASLGAQSGDVGWFGDYHV